MGSELISTTTAYPKTYKPLLNYKLLPQADHFLYLYLWARLLHTLEYMLLAEATHSLFHRRATRPVYCTKTNEHNYYIPKNILSSQGICHYL